MRNAYYDFMRDYIDAGHMIQATPAPDNPSNSYYVPHHIINKKKFRVVFDASCQTSTGVSLNDQQLPGGKLQADLGEILLLFRTFRWALSADIVKMFRQVKVNKSQWNYQRIFFRPSPSKPIQEYTITRVIWGFTSAGFNSVRALQQCVLDEKTDFPVASLATMTNFYMDDFLSGSHDVQGLRELHSQMNGMLKRGGFELAK